jgi:hypothetical protein
VGEGEVSSPDGQIDAEFGVTLSSSKTITQLVLTSAGGTWDTVPSNGIWFLGATNNATSPLLNTASANINITATSFDVYASDASTPTFFNPGNTFTLTATFSDGTSATGSVVIPSSSPTAALTPASSNASQVAAAAQSLPALQGIKAEIQGLLQEVDDLIQRAEQPL